MRCPHHPDKVIDHEKITTRIGSLPERLAVGKRESAGTPFAAGQDNVLVDDDNSGTWAIDLPSQGSA